jgi:hypothetical protein
VVIPFWDEIERFNGQARPALRRAGLLGENEVVREIDKNGVWVRGPNEREAKITRRQRGAFEIGRAQSLAVAVGDRLLIRGRHEEAGFANGDFVDVAKVDSVANKIVFTDGRELPPDFAAWTYGHAVTSYRSQGTTSEESLLVLGAVASRALGAVWE